MQISSALIKQHLSRFQNVCMKATLVILYGIEVRRHQVLHAKLTKKQQIQRVHI